MAFSTDYTEERGHPYAIQDLKKTKRVAPASPDACITCKSANLRHCNRRKQHGIP